MNLVPQNIQTKKFGLELMHGVLLGSVNQMYSVNTILKSKCENKIFALIQLLTGIAVETGAGFRVTAAPKFKAKKGYYQFFIMNF